MNSELSISKQCRLLGKSRSWYYYQEQVDPIRAFLDEKEKKIIRKIWKDNIFFGYRQIFHTLRRSGHETSPKRVYRLMKEMGIKAVVPKRCLSKPGKKHKKYPYLLRGLQITHPNQVWASDITYCALPGGIVYVVAIIDLYSRKILSWNVSNTMDTAFIMDALMQAMVRYGVPEIFNTDQGSQFTSNEFTSFLEGEMVRISMDGKGRALDNIYIERFWKTLKYENIYLYRYETMKSLRKGLLKYFRFYNSERPHQSLGGDSPDMIYFGESNLKAA